MMAKKQSLLEIAKATKPKYSGTRRWIERLTPEQQQEYKELIDAIRKSPSEIGVTLPNRGQIRDLVQKQFGITISSTVLRDHIATGV